MILQYFKKKGKIGKHTANEIYKKILVESKKLLINSTYFDQKNYNTSFEIVSIYLIIYIKLNIEFKVGHYQSVNEELINTFVDDLDDSLRSKGIGDMSIGKYVKSYVKKFYFRLSKFPKEFSEIDINTFSNYLDDLNFVKKEKNLIVANKFFNIFKDLRKSFEKNM
tara:strand:+ start:130 stop:627 length:498 start_codon:yes stop_codon:yes gene_type:complete